MVSVTVVVPAHNEEALLPRCLASLRKQTIRDSELIVVDSASTDRTEQVARSFGAKVIQLKQAGVGKARLAGCAAATGEIIASTDADTIVPPNWLECLLSSFREPQVLSVYGSLRFEGRGFMMRLVERCFLLWQRINHSLGRPAFCGPNFAVRKTAFAAVRHPLSNGMSCNAKPELQLCFRLRRLGEVHFLPELFVVTSPRRMGGLRLITYTIRYFLDYLRVCRLERIIDD